MADDEAPAFRNAGLSIGAGACRNHDRFLGCAKRWGLHSTRHPYRDSNVDISKVEILYCFQMGSGVGLFVMRVFIQGALCKLLEGCLPRTYGTFLT